MVDDIRWDYEAARLTCSRCGMAQVFHRGDDIGDFGPIDGKEVACSECGTAIWLSGDWVFPPEQFLLMEANRLIAEKRYMSAVLLSAQSYEVFGARFLREVLVDAPTKAEAPVPDGETLSARLNRRMEKLSDHIGKLTWEPLQKAVRKVVAGYPRILGVNPDCIVETALGSGNRNVAADGDPIETSPEFLAVWMRNTSRRPGQPANLRNKIVHKEAYRPSGEEARFCLSEVNWMLHYGGRALRVMGAMWEPTGPSGA